MVKIVLLMTVKFENFLEFLLEEKRVIAYESADLRTGSYGASRQGDVCRRE